MREDLKSRCGAKLISGFREGLHARLRKHTAALVTNSGFVSIP